MELNEAGRRILGQHWRLIVLALALGLCVGALLHRGDVKTYTASTRLALDAADPATRQESAAIADSAKAIATSPAQVRGALSQAHATGRDPAEVAKHHVTVRALGSSAILQLSVSDPSPRMAAALSNALAAAVISTRLDVGKGGVQQVLAGLDRQIAKLNQRIVSLNPAFAKLRESLIQRRGILQSERDSLVSADAVRPKPSIISAASPPDHADSSRLVPDMALGGLLALVLSVALAGLLETIRPTFVGGDALARELDTPLLGSLSGKPDQEGAFGEATRIATRLRLGAEVTEVRNVCLLAVGPQVDLRGLAERLNGPPAEEADPVLAEVLEAASSSSWESRERVSPYIGLGTATSTEAPKTDQNAGAGNNGRPDVWVKPFGPEEASLSHEGATALVLVTPEALKQTELVDTGHLLRVTRLPLLGLITYRPSSRLKLRDRRRPKTVDAQAGNQP
jgi:capsular polysaccharide biosynthesis protein